MKNIANIDLETDLPVATYKPRENKEAEFKL